MRILGGTETVTAGMDIIQAIKDGTQAPPAGIVTLGLDGGERWIADFGPGHAQVRWDVDPAYFNLEGAVICSWLGCLADQAIFYATNTLLDAGKVTRIATMNMTYGDPVTGGTVLIDARVINHDDGQLISEARFTCAGKLVALATAVSRIVDED